VRHRGMSLHHKYLHHSPAAIGALPQGNGGRGPPSITLPGVPRVRNTLLALLAVIAVMTAHAAYRLLWLPFRLLRGLFRHSAKPAQVTAR
jgi:hypothetical protein